MNEQPQWLIVLDNVEAPEMLREFLPEEPQGHLVLTSRAQVMGTIAQKIDLLAMDSGEGSWFLLRRAQKLALDAPFDAASPPDQQHARAISQELGGLPLALEQAGAYIEETGCSLPGYGERYREQHAELLKRRSPLSDPDYPWTVATTWTLSFVRVRQTNPAAAELLCFLAFLNPDGIPLSLIRNAASYLPRHLRHAAGSAVKLDGAIGDLRRYSLVQRHEEDEMPAIGEALSIHRLVQTVLKDAMPEKTRRKWAERTVKAVHQAFSVRVYIPQAQACGVLIEEYELASKEAANLLYQAGYQAQLRQLNWGAGLLYLKALLIFERIYKPRSMPVVSCLVRIAEVYQARKKYEEAESYYQRALDIREQLRGSAHPTVDECWSALAGLYTEQGNYEQAEAIYQELIEQANPDIADLESAAVLYMEQERYSEAEALIQRELAVLRSILEPTELAYLKVIAVIAYLADIYIKQGKMTEAEMLLQQELGTLRSVLAPTDFQVMTISEHLVGIYIEQEKRDEAEEMLRQLIDLRLQTIDEDAEEDVDLARNYLSLAEVLVDQGAYEEADVFYQRAVAIVDKHEIWERALLLKLLVSYATFLLKTKREEEAAQLTVRIESVYREIEGHNAFWEKLAEYLNEGEIRGDHLTDSSP
jgi:tetratricopeptide (TPR) repeat protein